jgi:hypothetical protein
MTFMISDQQRVAAFVFGSFGEVEEKQQEARDGRPPGRKHKGGPAVVVHKTNRLLRQGPVAQSA